MLEGDVDERRAIDDGLTLSEVVYGVPNRGLRRLRASVVIARRAGRALLSWIMLFRRDLADGRKRAASPRRMKTAVVRLGEFLKSRGSGSLACKFVSRLDDDKGPSNAIDKYGRFVGDIILDDGTNLNHWILENGLAVVSLYNSMSSEEVAALTSAWSAGKSRGIAKCMTSTIGPFNPELVERKPGSAIQDEGSHKFIHPKLFRRQCSWWAFKTAKLYKNGFDAFLKLSKDDFFYETEDYVENGGAAVPIQLEEMVTGSKVVRKPDEIVFKEAGSTLFSSAGTKLTKWL